MWTAPARKAWQRDWLWWIAVICPAFVRGTWPLAQMGYADRVPNKKMMSEHRWVPRGVPILGPTDRHLAAVLASQSGGAVSGSGRLRPVVEFAAH